MGFYVRDDYKFAPQLPGLVAPVDPRLFSNLANPGANAAVGVRVVIPRSGTLVDLSVLCGTLDGNFDVAVYDTAATTRTRLWSLGTTAMAGLTANNWSNCGDPNLVVEQGDMLDLAFAMDGAVGTIGRYTSQDAHLPAGFVPGDGAVAKLAWTIGASFVLPATLTEASLTESSTWAIIARIA